MKISFLECKMVNIIFTPDWFLGKDILIEGFSFIVLLIFFILALRYFKLDKENRSFLYLGVGFGLIALAQLAAVFTKLVLYYDIGPSQQIGQALVTTYQIVKSVDIFYYAGFFFHRLLTLLGFYIIYRFPRKKKSPGDFILAIYFIVISALLSEQVYYIFHTTALVLLVLIINKYYMVYKENKFFNTKILISAFGILALSQLIFILSRIEAMFAAANIVELISYVILLTLSVRILKHGKKKKSYGHNIRYTGNNPRKRRKH